MGPGNQAGEVLSLPDQGLTSKREQDSGTTKGQIFPGLPSVVSRACGWNMEPYFPAPSSHPRPCTAAQRKGEPQSVGFGLETKALAPAGPLSPCSRCPR